MHLASWNPSTSRPPAVRRPPLNKNRFSFPAFAALALAAVPLCIGCQDSVSTPAQATLTERAPSAPLPPAGPRKRAFLGTEARGLYVSSWVAGTKRLKEIADSVAASGLNALVIDVKDCTGKVAYDSALPLVAELKARERRIRDLDGVL